jgi:hypothetical protein
MKIKYWSFILLLSGSFSCKKLTEVFPKTEEPTNTTNPNAEVNGWIYDTMKSYYLWENQLTAKASTDNKLLPADYFESLLIKPGELDRFSWIQDERIGELPREWNWLPDEFGANPEAKLLHYTLGTPCFTEFHDTPQGDEWHRERALTDYCLQRADQ